MFKFPSKESQRAKADGGQRRRRKESIENESGVDNGIDILMKQFQAENGSGETVKSRRRAQPSSRDANSRRRTRMESNENIRPELNMNLPFSLDEDPFASKDTQSRSGFSEKSRARSTRSKENTVLNGFSDERTLYNSASEASQRRRRGPGDRKKSISNSDLWRYLSSLKIGNLFSDDNGDAYTAHTTDSNFAPDLQDPIVFNSILLQASSDADGFSVLFPDKYLEQKQKVLQINQYFESLQSKLAIELQVNDAADNITQSNSSDEKQIDDAQRRLTRSNMKLNEISRELFSVTSDLIHAERVVMKHIGGALRAKVEDLNQSMSNAPTLKVNRGDQELKRKLISAEVRIKELENQVKVISSNGGSSLEYDRLKLDFATTQAELADSRAEILSLKRIQGEMAIQLEEGQNGMLAKDREISNLLSELEELTTKMEMSKASANRDRNGDQFEQDTLGSRRSVRRSPPRRRNGSISTIGDSEAQELQKIIDSQASQLKELTSRHQQELSLSNIAAGTSNSQLKKEIDDLKKAHQSEIDKLKAAHELERLNALATAKSNFGEEISTLKKQHSSEMEDAFALAELDKTQYKASFQKEELQSKHRVEAAEQSLVDLKKEFFAEKEKLIENIDQLKEKLATAESELLKASEEAASRNTDLQAANGKLIEQMDALQTSLLDSNKNLEVKSRELIDIQSIHELELKRINQEVQNNILSLESEIENLKNAQEALLVNEAALKASNAETLAELEKFSSEIQSVKDQAKVDIELANEAKYTTSDQLYRAHRVLKDVTQDIARYKKIADERDDEVLSLKRLIREKEKQLEEKSLLGAGETSPVRRILEQKDQELDSTRAELRVAKTELLALSLKVDVLEREIEDTKSQMMRAAKADNDERVEEIARLQGMLLDLKTTRVDLLERLDDSQHEVETLKNKIAASSQN